jgi:poly(hydroxyalkanoate) granule-associated protein
MATKTSKAANSAKATAAKASATKDEANSALKGMANKIMESGQQIWLAGLGAFAKAQEEGGKLYEALIKEGSALEKITTKYTSGKVDEVRGAVENTVAQVKDRASDTWDKLEKVFEERVARALGGLGIPGREELNNLTAKVDELSKAVKGMGKAPAAKPTAAPAKAKAAPAVKAKPMAKPTSKKAAPAKVVKSVQSSVVKAAKSVQARASTAVASVSKSAQKTVSRASKAAQAAVKTVTDAVNEATGN